MDTHKDFIHGHIIWQGGGAQSKGAGGERRVDGRGRRGVVDELLVGHAD